MYLRPQHSSSFHFRPGASNGLQYCCRTMLLSMLCPKHTFYETAYCPTSARVPPFTCSLQDTHGSRSPAHKTSEPKTGVRFARAKLCCNPSVYLPPTRMPKCIQRMHRASGMYKHRCTALGRSRYNFVQLTCGETRRYPAYTHCSAVPVNFNHNAGLWCPLHVATKTLAY